VTPPVWRRPDPLGATTGGTTFGVVAAPLLAGFALSAVITLVPRDDGGVRVDVAIAAFAVAAGLLIFTVQAAIAASRYQVSPTDRLAWTPEAAVAPEWLGWLRDAQWRDEELARRYRARARFAYNAGILAFLTGLVAVLVPDPGEWRPGRIVAVVAAGFVLAIELLLVTGRPRTLSSALLPNADDYAADQARSARTTVPPIDLEALHALLTAPAPSLSVASSDGEIVAFQDLVTPADLSAGTAADNDGAGGRFPG
jgi:hypothetical protein